ncbi:MAG: hypothetical protein GF411_00050 [Candidatus Lokiarchaeota archaeon]|nr:hypothetical protein [Candidatus Lokiarchaeota archaeon]
MTSNYDFLLRCPKDSIIHYAMKHPEYTDHYVTKCGVVVTTGTRRFETNFTNFQIVEGTQATCPDCSS